MFTPMLTSLAKMCIGICLQNGATSLMIAAHTDKKLEFVKLLCAHGAQLNKQSKVFS